MMVFENIIDIPTPLVQIHDPLFDQKQVKVWVKRDDMTHFHISGNKFRKLKYNLLEAKKKGCENLITFGGAYSNHLAAFAFACNIFNFHGKAMVRGDELDSDSSPTLRFAKSQGLKLEFVSRASYRDKEALSRMWGQGHLIIPEGGSNSLALKGVAELVDELGEFDYLLTACGTGGTLAGLLKNAAPHQQILGVPVLKQGEFIAKNVSDLLNRPFPENGKLFLDYHFGGYAKHTPELLQFIKSFETICGIPLEQVYTGKAFYAFFDLLRKGYFKPESKIILLHTGGLQGKLKDS